LVLRQRGNEVEVYWALGIRRAGGACILEKEAGLERIVMFVLGSMFLMYTFNQSTESHRVRVRLTGFLEGF
jgi:hypothetical protein